MNEFLKGYIENAAFKHDAIDSDLLDRVCLATANQSGRDRYIRNWHADAIARVAWVSFDHVQLPEVLLQLIRAYVFDLAVAAQIETLRIKRFSWRYGNYELDVLCHTVAVNMDMQEHDFTWLQLYRCIAENRPLSPLTKSARYKLREDWRELFSLRK